MTGCFAAGREPAEGETALEDLAPTILDACRAPQSLGDFVTILIGGLAYAMILFIISVGLSVTMGLMGFINLAHGAFAMLGGYVMATAMNSYGVNYWLGLVLAFVIVALVSILFERLLYARLYDASELDQVLLTIGLVFMAIAATTFFWGVQPQHIQPPDYLKGRIDLGFREVATYRLFMIVTGMLLMGLLWIGLERTRAGARIRAAVDNRRMAQSLGINTARLFTLTFALGSGLAALGGALGSDIWGLDPDAAIRHLVLFLIIVSVGGLGNIKGAFFAAIILGTIEFGGRYLCPPLGAFFIYVTMIVILLWRPQGLFGRA